MAVHFPIANATFIHVPKTGGTSFYSWIEDNLVSYDIQTTNVYETGCVEGAEKQWGDLGTIFSFVRNPYSRLVSMFHFQWKEAEQYLTSNIGSAHDRIGYARTAAISRKGFDYWLECMYFRKPELFAIADADPERVTVSSWFNGRKPDVWIKTENLKDDFHIIQDLLTGGICKVPLPWINTSEHKPYRDYYNSTTKRWVAEQFREDLEAFDYQF